MSAKEIVSNIVNKKLHQANDQIREQILRIATDQIELRKIQIGKSFFESVAPNTLDEDVETLEEEDLQELSKGKLAKYITHASHDAVAKTIGTKNTRNSNKQEKSFDKGQDRLANVNLAARKLATNPKDAYKGTRHNRRKIRVPASD